ncbi:MAG: hypothetical protein WC234_02950 [Endomicrobiaceae bacterium]
MIPEPLVQGYKQSDEEYVEYLEEFERGIQRQLKIQSIFLIVGCICFAITLIWVFILVISR